MTLWESHKGCIPMDGWKDRLVTRGIEDLCGHESPSRDCLPWHSKRTWGKEIYLFTVIFHSLIHGLLPHDHILPFQ